jgi:predicted hydrolase (HD superfamily)
MGKFVRKNVTIREDQLKIIEKHGLNLSKFLQNALDRLKKGGVA